MDFTFTKEQEALRKEIHDFFVDELPSDIRPSLLVTKKQLEFMMELQKKAGIERRCHLHGLRHTAASELLEEGFDIATIARQLGHAHMSTTSRYLHQLRPDIMNERLKERTW